MTDDPDTAVRMAAFEHVRRLNAMYGYVTSEDLRRGFGFGGERIPLVNPQQGIFKPRSMRFLLSIRTVIPKTGGKIWYDDQRVAHRQIFSNDESVDYSFMGTDPQAPQNRWLREAFENQIPVIYFLGFAPKLYQAVIPTYISGWNEKALSARVVFGNDDAERPAAPPDLAARHYALRTVKQRLHQASFREAVISAYSGRCALSGLPEQRLLDAAHIVSDKDEKFGQPIIQNGLPLSKIHHAAFDAHLIGIDPDYRLHVSDRLRMQHDGPMLEVLKQLDGGRIHLPLDGRHNPDRDRLALRFDQYRKAA